MMLFRVGFVFYFGDTSHLELYKVDLLTSLFIGWKYDSLVISYLLAPLFLVLIPVSMIKKIWLFNLYQFLVKLYFFVFAIIIPVILIADLSFFSFFQDHINILFFGIIEDDTIALIKTIWSNYPVLYILGILMAYMVIIIMLGKKIFPKVFKKGSFITPGIFKYLLMVTIFLVLLFGGLRGGYGDLVISPKYSDFSESEFVNQVAVNGVVALEKTIKLRHQRNGRKFDMTKAMGYGNDIHKAFGDFLGFDVSSTQKSQLVNLIKRRTAKNEFLEENKLNIIVLVMESFGSHWMKYNSDHFNFLGDLKVHFEKDTYLNNIISSDNGTIGSLLSIATNIPNRPGKRFLSESKFMQLPLASAAHKPYSRKGYESTFVYGGKLGWRDIGKYFKYQEYANLIGENAISKSLGLKGNNGTEWGLFDEHFFNYIYKKINESTRPQFILGLSTSNHPPFAYPKDYKVLPLNLPEELNGKIAREKDLFLKRFSAFQYSNVMLANFLNKIKASSLKDNTIVVVTGDHNFWGFMNYEKSEMYTKYSVPLYFYLPEKLKIEKFDTNKIGSHEDIMSTLYNISLSDTEYISFGEDLFSNEKTYAFNSSLYAGDEGIVYKGNSFHWENFPEVNKTRTEDKFKLLLNRYRSTITISDYYLEESFRSEKSIKKND